MSEPQTDWAHMAYQCLLSRALDQLEENQLTPQGKVKLQFSAGGHELAQVLLAGQLTHPHDAAAVYYRSRPFLLANGLTVREALAADMAYRGSPSEGRDVGVVFSLPRRGGAVVLPSSGDVGTQYTPAAGWAQAICYRQQVLAQAEWAGAVAVALGGDGSVATNGFWSALTMATTLNLPMLFFIEDNGYGISVPSRFQTPGGNIADNLAAFKNLKIIQADGHEPTTARAAIAEAVAQARAGRPTLLRLRVARLGGHTFIDDQAYKSTDQKTEEAGRDPLLHLKKLFTDTEWQGLVEKATQAVNDASAAEYVAPDPGTVTRHLFYEGQAQLVGGRRAEQLPETPKRSEPETGGPRMNMLEAIKRTLDYELAQNKHVLVFGEDVGVKGGVHGATIDLQLKYGAERVFDTSLSEEGIIGRSVGMALAGLVPVPEIQFRKYADPAHEQISDAGTMRWRTAGKFAAPMVVRIPVGFGKKTGDPWHSMSGEAVYAHTLGWRIAIPSNAQDAVGLLRTALRGDDPTFFLEHRALLDTPMGRRPYPGDGYWLPFGEAAVLTQGNELAVVSWGEAVHRCLEAAQAFEGRVQILDLRTISPWDKDTVLAAVRACGKLLVVHEDTWTGGFGAEIAATVASECFTDLDAPIARLATPDLPIPYNVGLMEAAIPSVAVIRNKMESLLAY